MRTCFTVLFAFVLLFIFGGGSETLHAQNDPDGNAVLYFFWGEGCPYCERERAFLEELQQNVPELEVRAFEVWHHPENIPILREMAAAYGIRPRAVPLTFVGAQHWVGFSESIGSAIEDAVRHCVRSGCENPALE